MTTVGDGSTRLIVIRGNSGSGKSTLASAIRQARPRGIAIVGHDQLRREILHVSDRPGALSVEYIDLTVRFALGHGLHVIVEGILHNEIYGQMLRQLLSDHGGVSRCYRFEVSFDETMRRHATRENKARQFGADQMRAWWRDSDPLHGIEERIIGPDSDLETSLRTVLEDCEWIPLATPAPSRS